MLIDGAKNFLQALGENLMQALPFTFVNEWEGGVLLVCGRVWKRRDPKTGAKVPVPLGPGFHWRVWVFMDVRTVNVVEEVIDIPKQTMTTKDGRVVSVSMNIGRVVTDPVKYFTCVQDFDKSTVGMARNHIHARIRKMDYDTLMATSDELETSLRNTLSTRWRDWGAEVVRCGFDELFPASQQIVLVQDPTAPRPV